MIAAVAACVAAALALALGLAAAGPVAVLVAALGLVQVLVAVRWFAMLDVSGAARGGAVVGAGAAIAADLAVVLRDDEHPLAPAAAVLGLAMLAAMLLQLVRRDGREELTASLATTVALAVVAGLGSCYLGTQSSRDGTAFVAAAVAAATVAVVGAALPGPSLVCAGAGLVGGVAAGVVVGLVSDLGPGRGGLFGLGCTIAAAVGVSFTHRAVRPEPLVTASLPLLLAAPVALVLSRLLAP
jgi:hypothetical protein